MHEQGGGKAPAQIRVLEKPCQVRTCQHGVHLQLLGGAAPIVHGEAGQPVGQLLYGGRCCWLSCRAVVEEPQLQQAGVQAERAEVGKQAGVMAGGLQRETAQGREPATAGPTLMPRIYPWLAISWSQ